MVRMILLAWAISSLAIGLASAVLPGFDVDEGIVNYIIVALLFGLVNVLIGPILRLLTLPLTLITLGLFTLVVNGALLALTAWLTPLVDIDGFFAAMIAALVISIFTSVIGWLLGLGKEPAST